MLSNEATINNEKTPANTNPNSLKAQYRRLSFDPILLPAATIQMKSPRVLVRNVKEAPDIS
jgi:hypothetical protein